jgi:glycosyltransferase involved in cell wall biosynthesis
LSAAGCSVLVPAHDEERVVGRCVDAVLAETVPGGIELLVVANGCSDGTAAAARRHGAEVLELAVASKAAALRAGDDRLQSLPRIYLDADIVLSPGAVAALVAALPADVPRVAAPRADYVTTGRPLLVRAFYAVYTQLPYVSSHMVGSGVYALSAAGRARFGSFPQLTADDLFVQRHFAPEEVVVLPQVSFAIETPHTLRSLLAVRTRTALGNTEVAGLDLPQFRASSASTLRALGLLLLRRPHLVPAAVVYVAITVVARRRAAARPPGWQRDETTR